VLYTAPDLDGGGRGAQAWWEVKCSTTGLQEKRLDCDLTILQELLTICTI